MKRFIAILLALMLFIAVMPTSAFAASTKTVYVSRNGGKIYLHTGPGYEYDTTNTVKHDNKVTVLDKDGVWSKVKVNATGKTGWIRTMYIDGTTKKLADGYKAIKVSGGKAVKVYSTWDVNSKVKMNLYAGDTVQVNGTEHDFAKVVVTSNKVVGWVALPYIGETVSVIPTKPADSSKVYHTTASVLNLRKGPGTGYAIIGKLPYGTGCTILKSSGNWRKIKTLKGTIGWVSANYLTLSTTARVSTNGSNLNIRTAPSTKATILGSLKNGTKVVVQYTSGNWAYVNYGKLEGWMSLTWLKF